MVTVEPSMLACGGGGRWCHHEEKPDLVGMRVVGEGLGLGLGVEEGQC